MLRCACVSYICLLFVLCACPCVPQVGNTWAVPFRLSIGFNRVRGEFTGWTIMDILFDLIYLTNILVKSRLVCGEGGDSAGEMGFATVWVWCCELFHSLSVCHCVLRWFVRPSTMPVRW